MNSYHNCSFYPVGSEAEGFRIIGSDIDHMIVLKDYVVVNNRTEISELSCVKSNKAVITMETQHPKPGYVRLILETANGMVCENMRSAFHYYDDRWYLSSTKFREHEMSSMGNNEIYDPCIIVN